MNYISYKVCLNKIILKRKEERERKKGIKEGREGRRKEKYE